jgi:hypothetical protein
MGPELVLILSLIPAVLLGAMIASPVAYERGRRAVSDDLRIVEGLRMIRHHTAQAIGTSAWPEPLSPRTSDTVRDMPMRREPEYVPAHTAAGRRWAPRPPRPDVHAPVRAALIPSRPPIWITDPMTVVIGRAA